MEYSLQPLAHICSDFAGKFGVPRQSGLADALQARLVFEPAFRNPDALRGIEEFSHLWLIWRFHAAGGAEFSPTVRPPRLGGNTRKGVFATRSPFRPNRLGLSCVRLLGLEQTAQEGTVLRIAGADLMDGTPIFDIKPYLPYADSIPDARGGFADAAPRPKLTVYLPPALEACIPQDKREALRQVLALDPRPAYQDDPARVYGFGFAGLEIRFRVQDGTAIVCEVLPGE